ncbi:MAG: hypothetical protein LBJ67_14710 [Planctomycetaceae bacterium]|nr:hypothetical protein [Planctomycetaceae bacterium]
MEKTLAYYRDAASGQRQAESEKQEKTWKALEIKRDSAHREQNRKGTSKNLSLISASPCFLMVEFVENKVFRSS